MNIRNIAGYKFINLTDLSALRTHLLEQCLAGQLKGTILLSPEGINLSLAGTIPAVEALVAILAADERFADMNFRVSYSDFQPFKRMKVKVKKEIIAFRQPEIRPELQRASTIAPQQLQQWLHEKKDFLLLDTRNDYEIELGTFVGATTLHLNDFCEFPAAAQQLPRTKPIVMFCTGGVRCEKAGLHLLNQGFSEVYQLEGGILNYFAEVGGAHYSGGCFVFDERVAVNADLQPITI